MSAQQLPARTRAARWIPLPAALLAAACTIDPLHQWNAAQRWTPGQKATFAFNVGCNAVDAVQTNWAVQNGYDETNPTYGNHPSTSRIVGTKVVGMLLQESFVDGAFKPEDRLVPLLALTAGCVAVVAHNYGAGARP